jgi:hypothetical protein
MRYSRQTTFQLSVILVLLIITIVQACTHEPLVVKDNTTPPDTPPVETDDCDPNVVYFQNEVLPVLISNCAKSGCHDAVTAEQGIILDSYAHIMASDVIEPSEPDDSELYERITEDDADKVMPPPPHQPLSADQIETIRNWIAQGSQNNACTATDCSTDAVTFSGTIFPLVTNKCLGCHSGNTPSGDLNFSSHLVLQTVAQDGRLIGAVTHAPGFTAMPLGGSKLSECEIDQITEWIAQGAPDN